MNDTHARQESARLAEEKLRLLRELAERRAREAHEIRRVAQAQ